MKKAVIVAFDNFTDVDVFLPWDLLNRVRFREKDFEVKIVGTKEMHRSKNGIELRMHGGIEECTDADLVFFSSGAETRHLYKDDAYLNRFKLDADKQLVCSMCSGALLLGALGLLNGLTATTYPTAFQALRELGVNVVEDFHLVAHGNVATAAGCLAAVDLVGWAIEKLYGEKMKQDVIASVLPVGQGQVCIY
jgi:transcriptional regulator GlxA family with amidase domain